MSYKDNLKERMGKVPGVKILGGGGGGVGHVLKHLWIKVLCTDHFLQIVTSSSIHGPLIPL